MCTICKLLKKREVELGGNDAFVRLTAEEDIGEVIGQEARNKMEEERYFERTPTNELIYPGLDKFWKGIKQEHKPKEVYKLVLPMTKQTAEQILSILTTDTTLVKS